MCVLLSAVCFCGAWGDPHYTAFNGRKQNYQVPCKFTAAKSKDRSTECAFDVETKNVHYHGTRVSIATVMDIKIFGHTFRFWNKKVWVSTVFIMIWGLQSPNLTSVVYVDPHFATTWRQGRRAIQISGRARVSRAPNNPE